MIIFSNKGERGVMMKKLIVRKLYRLVLLVVPVIYYYWYKKYYVLAIVCAFAFSLTLDIIRLTNPTANDKVRQFLGLLQNL